MTFLTNIFTGIFQNTSVGHALLAGELPLPDDKDLPNTNIKFPYYCVGDAAFPLKRNIMRPFPGRLLSQTKRIFNYRLSRARRIIENSFGILVARWRILKTSMHCLPHNAEKITLACIALHNFLMINSPANLYCPPNYTDYEDSNGNVHLGEWRNEVDPLRQARFGSNNAARSAFDLRNTLANYFMAEGAVAFQYEKIND